MSGSSLRCLIVKDPQPGDWKMAMTVPKGVSFHCECNTVPSQDPYTTITDTLSSTNRIVKRSKQSSHDVTGWVGPALVACVAGAWAGVVLGSAAGSAGGPLGSFGGAVVGGFIGAVVGKESVYKIEEFFLNKPDNKPDNKPYEVAPVAADLHKASLDSHLSAGRKRKRKKWILEIVCHGMRPVIPGESFIVPPNVQIKFFVRDGEALDELVAAGLHGRFVRGQLDRLNAGVVETVSSGSPVIDYYLSVYDPPDPTTGQPNFFGDRNGVYSVGSDIRVMLLTDPNILEESMNLESVLNRIILRLRINPLLDEVVVYYNACRSDAD